MGSFSPELIARCRRIVATRSGSDIDDEQAEMYLEKLARLGLLAIKVINNKQRYGDQKESFCEANRGNR